MKKVFNRIDPDLILVLTLLVFGLVAYSNSFTGSFQFDDRLHILRNEAFTDFTNVSKIYHYDKGRFLPHLTLALNYKISKFDPISYHTFNFFIHYIAAIFLYFLFLEICKTPAIQSVELNLPERLGAFLAAGIFFLHPLQTESVTYIIQRAESMAGMFYLATLFFYLKARRAKSRRDLCGYALLAGIAAVCAAFSKETAVTLPAMILIVEIFFFETSIKDLLGKKIFWLLMTPAAIFLLLKLQPLIRTGFFYDPGPGLSFTRKQYLLTQFSVLLTYLQLFFWPANQNVDWDYPLATSFLSLQTLAPFLLLLLLLVFAFFAYRRLRLVSLGIVAFFITLAPTSSIIPIRDVIFEHRMYLAVAFLAMACVQLCFYGLAPIGERSPRRQSMVFCALIIVLFPLFSGLTHARNRVWLNEVSLWEDAAEKSPNKARVRKNYGKSLLTVGFGSSEKAKREFEAAIRLAPASAVAYHDLGVCYWQEEDYQRAVTLGLEAIQRRPKYKDALYLLGTSYKKLHQWDEAREYLERLIGMSPGSRYIGAYLDLLEVYLELGLEDDALDVAGKVRQLPDGVMRLDYHRGLAFYKLKQMETARSYFVKQTEQESDRLKAYIMLGQICYLEGDYQRAEMAFRQAVEESEWSVHAHYNLAIILEHNGRLHEASEHLEKAVAVDPFSIDTSVRLVSLYNRLGYTEKQAERLRKLLGLKPSSVEYGYIEASQSQDLERTLRGYEERFLSSDTSPLSLKAMAIITTLRKDYEKALALYKSYLQTIQEKREVEKITREVNRLEELVQGRESLRILT
jgi:tetratricopeptide (TPR) repeat protein